MTFRNASVFLASNPDRLYVFRIHGYTVEKVAEVRTYNDVLSVTWIGENHVAVGERNAFLEIFEFNGFNLTSVLRIRVPTDLSLIDLSYNPRYGLLAVAPSQPYVLVYKVADVRITVTSFPTASSTHASTYSTSSPRSSTIVYTAPSSRSPTPTPTATYIETVPLTTSTSKHETTTTSIIAVRTTSTPTIVEKSGFNELTLIFLVLGIAIGLSLAILAVKRSISTSR